MYIGLDIGGTKILGCLVDEKTIIQSFKEKTQGQDSAEIILEQIKNVCRNLMGDRKIGGIGIGMPGNINKDTGVVVFSPNLPFKDFPMKQLLEKEFKIPVAIGNDVNMGLLGEHWAGAAASYRNVVGIFIGTGIGGAIILDNKLYHGHHHIAGEIGHMKIKLNGPLCNCGETGCFEALASKLGIQRYLEKNGFHFDSIIKSSFLKEQLGKNNKTVKNVLKKVSGYIGEVTGNVVNILDPEAIILGGGVMESVGDYMLKKIKPVANARALAKPTIKLSALKDYAVVYGAVRLISTLNKKA
ncbi:MAG: ROK family protein [Candidatus Margulisbacteria bacterium]|nr:ROK family protein [Candidatus Margulisiibacteriota bacterium]